MEGELKFEVSSLMIRKLIKNAQGNLYGIQFGKGN